jgi:hypothetical protein
VQPYVLQLGKFVEKDGISIRYIRTFAGHLGNLGKRTYVRRYRADTTVATFAFFYTYTGLLLSLFQNSEPVYCKGYINLHTYILISYILLPVYFLSALQIAVEEPQIGCEGHKSQGLHPIGADLVRQPGTQLESPGFRRRPVEV